MAIKKGVKNYLSSLGAYLAMMLGGFLITPIILASLGSIDFGIYKSIQKIFGYGQVAEGRVSETFKLKLGEKIGKDLNSNALFGRAVSLWLRYLPLGFVIYFAIGLSYPFWLDLGGDDSEIPLALFIFTLSLIVKSFSSLVEANWHGRFYAYKVFTLNFAFVLALNISLFILLPKYASLVGIFSIDLIIAVMRLISLLIKGQIEYSLFNKLNIVVRSRIDDFAALNLQNLVWSLVNRVFSSLDTLIIVMVFGSFEVGQIALIGYVGALSLNLFTFIPNAVMPAISHAKANDKLTELKNPIWQLMLCYNVLLLSCFFGFRILNKYFLDLWIGIESVAYIDTVNFWLYGYLFLLGSLKFDLLLMNGLRMFKEKSRVITIYIINSIGLVFLLKEYLITLKVLFFILSLAILVHGFFISLKVANEVGLRKVFTVSLRFLFLLLFLCPDSWHFRMVFSVMGIVSAIQGYKAFKSVDIV